MLLSTPTELNAGHGFTVLIINDSTHTVKANCEFVKAKKMDVGLGLNCIFYLIV